MRIRYFWYWVFCTIAGAFLSVFLGTVMPLGGDVLGVALICFFFIYLVKNR